MEDFHKNNGSEQAPQPGTTVHISHTAQQILTLDNTLPLPQMEHYNWPVQTQMEYRGVRH
uniref:Uncharacterized protein n=1 Tax=Vombatus ursinus TaxID=29139 RepID=A0A4X2KB44_VOMUR